MKRCSPLLPSRWRTLWACTVLHAAGGRFATFFLIVSWVLWRISIALICKTLRGKLSYDNGRLRIGIDVPYGMIAVTIDSLGRSREGVGLRFGLLTVEGTTVVPTVPTTPELVPDDLWRKRFSQILKRSTVLYSTSVRFASPVAAAAIMLVTPLRLHGARIRFKWIIETAAGLDEPGEGGCMEQLLASLPPEMVTRWLNAGIPVSKGSSRVNLSGELWQPSLCLQREATELIVGFQFCASNIQVADRFESPCEVTIPGTIKTHIRGSPVLGSDMAIAFDTKKVVVAVQDSDLRANFSLEHLLPLYEFLALRAHLLYPWVFQEIMEKVEHNSDFKSYFFHWGPTATIEVDIAVPILVTLGLYQEGLKLHHWLLKLDKGMGIHVMPRDRSQWVTPRARGVQQLVNEALELLGFELVIETRGRTTLSVPVGLDEEMTIITAVDDLRIRVGKGALGAVGNGSSYCNVKLDSDVRCCIHARRGMLEWKQSEGLLLLIEVIIMNTKVVKLLYNAAVPPRVTTHKESCGRRRRRQLDPADLLFQVPNWRKRSDATVKELIAFNWDHVYHALFEGDEGAPTRLGSRSFTVVTVNEVQVRGAEGRLKGVVSDLQVVAVDDGPGFDPTTLISLRGVALKATDPDGAPSLSITANLLVEIPSHSQFVSIELHSAKLLLNYEPRMTGIDTLLDFVWNNYEGYLIDLKLRRRSGGAVYMPSSTAEAELRMVLLNPSAVLLGPGSFKVSTEKICVRRGVSSASFLRIWETDIPAVLRRGPVFEWTCGQFKRYLPGRSECDYIIAGPNMIWDIFRGSHFLLNEPDAAQCLWLEFNNISIEALDVLTVNVSRLSAVTSKAGSELDLILEKGAVILNWIPDLEEPLRNLISTIADGLNINFQQPESLMALSREMGGSDAGDPLETSRVSLRNVELKISIGNCLACVTAKQIMFLPNIQIEQGYVEIENEAAQVIITLDQFSAPGSMGKLQFAGVIETDPEGINQSARYLQTAIISLVASCDPLKAMIPPGDSNMQFTFYVRRLTGVVSIPDTPILALDAQHVQYTGYCTVLQSAKVLQAGALIAWTSRSLSCVQRSLELSNLLSSDALSAPVLAGGKLLELDKMEVIGFALTVGSVAVQLDLPSIVFLLLKTSSFVELLKSENQIRPPGNNWSVNISVLKLLSPPLAVWIHRVSMKSGGFEVLTSSIAMEAPGSGSCLLRLIQAVFLNQTPLSALPIHDSESDVKLFEAPSAEPWSVRLAPSAFGGSTDPLVTVPLLFPAKYNFLSARFLDVSVSRTESRIASVHILYHVCLEESFLLLYLFTLKMMKRYNLGTEESQDVQVQVNLGEVSILLPNMTTDVKADKVQAPFATWIVAAEPLLASEEFVGSSLASFPDLSKRFLDKIWVCPLEFDPDRAAVLDASSRFIQKSTSTERTGSFLALGGSEVHFLYQITSASIQVEAEVETLCLYEGQVRLAGLRGAPRQETKMLRKLGEVNVCSFVLNTPIADAVDEAITSYEAELGSVNLRLGPLEFRSLQNHITFLVADAHHRVKSLYSDICGELSGSLCKTESPVVEIVTSGHFIVGKVVIDLVDGLGQEFLSGVIDGMEARVDMRVAPIGRFQIIADMNDLKFFGRGPCRTPELVMAPLFPNDVEVPGKSGDKMAHVRFRVFKNVPLRQGAPPAESVAQFYALRKEGLIPNVTDRSIAILDTARVAIHPVKLQVSKKLVDVVSSFLSFQHVAQREFDTDGDNAKDLFFVRLLQISSTTVFLSTDYQLKMSDVEIKMGIFIKKDKIFRGEEAAHRLASAYGRAVIRQGGHAVLSTKLRSIKHKFKRKDDEEGDSPKRTDFTEVLTDDGTEVSGYEQLTSPVRKLREAQNSRRARVKRIFQNK